MKVVKVGDLIKRKCIRPEYGLIVNMRSKKCGPMSHNRLTILWDDGTQGPAWAQDVELVQ